MEGRCPPMRLFEGALAASLYLADRQDWSRRALDGLGEETKQQPQQMSYARALLGGGRSARAARRLPRSHSRSRLRNEKNPSIPRHRPAQWISCCRALHERLTNPRSTGQTTVITRRKASSKNTSAPRPCFHGAVFKQAIPRHQGVVLPHWWSRIQSVTYDGGEGPSASLRQPPALVVSVWDRVPEDGPGDGPATRSTGALRQQTRHATYKHASCLGVAPRHSNGLPQPSLETLPCRPAWNDARLLLCPAVSEHQGVQGVHSGPECSYQPCRCQRRLRSPPQVSLPRRTRAWDGSGLLYPASQLVPQSVGRAFAKWFDISTGPSGSIFDSIVLLQHPTSTGWIMGAVSRWRSLGPRPAPQRRTEETMQLLHMPQETVCQVRASFVAACLKVEGCGCGFRDGPLAPCAWGSQDLQMPGPYVRVARPN